MHFDKVGFIGLGLIGGSIARKMKENNNYDSCDYILLH